MKRVNFLTDLAVEVALGLAAYEFGQPTRVSDARLISSGMFPSLWERWPSLDDRQRLRFAWLLRLQPESLGDERSFVRAAIELIGRNTAYRWVDTSQADELLHTFEPIPAKPLDRTVDELLEKLETRRKERLPHGVQVADTTTGAFRFRKTSFSIPATHLKHDGSAKWPTLTEAARKDRLMLRRDELLKMAGRIDVAGICGVHHRQRVEDFLNNIRHGSEALSFDQQLEVLAGCSQLVSAPTGQGKTVRARKTIIVTHRLFGS